MSSSASRQRALPSVDTLLTRLPRISLPRPVVVAEVRDVLERWRRDAENPVPPLDALVHEVVARLGVLERRRLHRVINGTGVLAHTNLGRAPLAPEAAHALQEVAQGYCNLELDLETGERGARGAYVERALAILCGAPAATVVNNGAAALVLALRALVRPDRAEVILSRGELVQIGGGFRIPEILEASGARLREVGTTNQTTLQDYESALGPATALLLRVHRSNFHMEGFVSSPTTAELASLARRHELPLVEDLGSGAITRLEDLHADLHHEPTPAETFQAGADLVCFSGDKLLGGPQAGILVGCESLIRQLRAHPFFRALRCDKLVLAALQATVDLHLAGAGKSATAPPMTELLRLDPASLRERAERLISQLAGGDPNIPASLVSTRAVVGGGVCPKSTVPSIAVSLRPSHLSLDAFSRRLRLATPPIVGCVQDGTLRLDLRTILPAQDIRVVAGLRAAWASPASSPP